MAEGVRTQTVPVPGKGFNPEDEAQFRRMVEQFMQDTKGRITRLTGGGLVFIAGSTVASPVSSVDFTTGIDSTYDEYVLILSNVIPVTDSDAAWLRTSTDAGSTWDTGASDYSWILMSVNTIVTPARTFDAADAQIVVSTSEIGSDTNERGISMWIHLVRPSTAAYFQIHANAAYSGTTVNRMRMTFSAGMRLAAADVDGIRFLFSTGNVESGVLRLYGVAKS